MQNRDQLKNELLEIIQSPDYRPMINKDLFNACGEAEEDREIFYEVLEELYKEGKIFKTAKGKYCTPEAVNVYTGVLQKNERGFGFLLLKNKNRKDIFVAKNKMNGAMHQDVVAVKLIKKSHGDGKDEGEVLKILKREKISFVGRFEKSRFFGFVVVDDKRFNEDIYIKNEDSAGAKDGDKVIVEVTVWPQGGRSAEGRIVEILGRVGQKGVDVLSILRAHGFNEVFPEEVVSEADSISQTVSEKDMEGRRDLREQNIFTIDGSDTKDIDDAISVEKLPDGNYRLGVHIADVSHYVKEGAPLDSEAYKRGTSVYMVDRVAPMLPKSLSNGICSLNPKVDRLALSVLMDIDSEGTVYNHEIFKSVIRSREQMTYENVYKILEEDNAELKERYDYLLKEFYLMKELALVLRAKRDRRGAIDFDFPEAKVLIDDKGKPVDVVKREITIANRIIEEFMLACNETVAEHFYWMEVPFLYRIHENPEPEKINNLAEFLRVMGYNLKGSAKLHPRTLQELLNKIKGRKEERIISTIMLRSLQKARYSSKTDIHFGLAATYYSHFTSPIRRYPDLMIHRVITYILSGEMDDELKERLNGIMSETAEHCSEMERAADDAEKESVKVKMAEFMSKHIGERFTGVISGIASFGMFVELDNLIEGLIRVTTMEDDYYIFDEKNYSFIGERLKKTYRIGDEVEIIVTNTDISSRTIEFELALSYND